MPFALIQYLAFSVCVFIIIGGYIVIGSSFYAPYAKLRGCIVNKNQNDRCRIIRHDTTESGFAFHWSGKGRLFLSWKATKMMMSDFFAAVCNYCKCCGKRKGLCELMGMECVTVGVFGEAEWMAKFGVCLDFSALFASWESTLCGRHLHAIVWSPLQVD